jgi:hypothetical protein
MTENIKIHCPHNPAPRVSVESAEARLTARKSRHAQQKTETDDGDVAEAMLAFLSDKNAQGTKLADIVALSVQKDGLEHFIEKEINNGVSASAVELQKYGEACLLGALKSTLKGMLPASLVVAASALSALM